jgi:hypothetical protein
MEQEIKFIALPTAKQLELMLEDRGQYPVGKEELPVVQRYRAQQWRIVQAQRKAAAIAAEVIRPNEFKDVYWKYRQRVRDARSQFEDECVAIFSEICTKGLD